MVRCEQHAPGSDAPGHLAGQEESPLAALLGPAVLSSAARPGWGRMLVEVHQNSNWEGQARFPFHIVALLVNPPGRLSCRLEEEPVRSGRPAPGAAIVVPAGRLHWGAWEDRSAFLLACVTPDALAHAVSDAGFDADDFDLRYRFETYDRDMTALLLALHAQLARSGAEDHLYVDSIGVDLAVHLLRRYGTTPPRLREYRRGLSRTKLRLVLDYLNANLHRNISLAELAGLLEMSQFHFLRQFRTSSGRTPHQYLVERRVQVAGSILLREGASLADVAYRVGFADQSHLTRHFRRIMGISPGRMRRQDRPAS